MTLSRSAVVGLVAAIAVGALLVGLSMRPYQSMDGYDGWGWHGSWWPMMGFGMLLFWVPLIVLGVWLLTRGSPSRPALEELDARYARGDISREEYQRVRDDITKRQ